MDKISSRSISFCGKELINKTCLSLAREQFIHDIKIAIGPLQDLAIPLSIRPTLQKLLEISDDFLRTAEEDTFMQYFLKALEVSGQGWNFLSYLSASEPNDCYSLFWGLKAALEKYQRASFTSQDNS